MQASLTANVAPELEPQVRSLAIRALLPPDKRTRFYCPKRKISHLEAWILTRALEGVSDIEERARAKEKSTAKINKFARGLHLNVHLTRKRARRREIAHLSRAEILAGYFGLDRGQSDWWRRTVCHGIVGEAYQGKTVGDLSPALLKAAVRGWCPKVEAAGDRVSERARKTYDAILEANKVGSLYNRANASTCRALRRLRKRGFLEPAQDNRCIRLTPLGRKIARELGRLF
jgi:hypothetical protein